MADKSLTRKTAGELAAMIKSRAASPVEVLDAHLAVIARVNPKLNAMVTLAAEQAREHARAVEAAVMRGERLGRFSDNQRNARAASTWRRSRRRPPG